MQTLTSGLAAPLGLSEASVGDYIALMKPRVMSLVVFTGFAGYWLAPGHLHPVLAAVAILCIAIGAGAAGAINMWYDYDIDQVMSRTRSRPVASGRVSQEEALGFGVIMAGASVLLMGLAVNIPAAALLALTIGFYVFIYTMWLKRRTPHNIVIGGAAGALPPMIGWTAVTGDIGLPSLILFGLIFFWTPPHFWALALLKTGEYKAAGVPMMPVILGPRETKKQIILYTLVLWPLALAPVFIHMAGWFYAAVALTLSVIFTRLAVAVWYDETSKAPRRLFAFSLLYLFVLFSALLVDNTLGLRGL
jgi:protoheme IX farnesyltransferase